MVYTLNTDALTTPDRVAEFTGSDLPVPLINAASSWFINRCDQTFHREDVTETVPGYGLDALVLSRRPVVSLTSIAFDGAALTDISDVVIRDNGLSGRITRPGGWLWTAQRVPNITHQPIPGTEQPLYSVVYRGGYVTPWQVDSVNNADVPITAVDSATVANLPTDLELAIIAIAQAFKTQLTWDGVSVKSEKLITWGATYDRKTGVSLVDEAIEKYQRID